MAENSFGFVALVGVGASREGVRWTRGQPCGDLAANVAALGCRPVLAAGVAMLDGGAGPVSPVASGSDPCAPPV